MTAAGGMTWQARAFVLAGGTVAASVVLMIGLMLSYDLRHAAEFDCGPGEVSGRIYYPCGPDEPYFVHPSGLELLGAFLTWQPEPTPVLVMPRR